MPALSNSPGVQLLCATLGPRLELPLLMSLVPAGFPSPAEDYIDQHLDLNEHLVSHPASTFYLRVVGESMAGDNIHPGDILVVDRAVEQASGRIIIAVLDGEFTVKRLRHKHGRIFLEPSNLAFKPVEITPDMDFEVWGVVTFIIHKA